MGILELVVAIVVAWFLIATFEYWFPSGVLVWLIIAAMILAGLAVVVIIVTGYASGYYTH